jgi:hypothetical protein
MVIASPDERLETQNDYAAKGVFDTVVMEAPPEKSKSAFAQSQAESSSKPTDVTGNAIGGISNISRLRAMRQHLLMQSSKKPSKESEEDKGKSKEDAEPSESDVMSMLANIDYSDVGAPEPPRGAADDIDTDSLKDIISW